MSVFLQDIIPIECYQGKSSYAIMVVYSVFSLKEKHSYYYQCHVVVFTLPEHDICICEVGSDRLFWDNMKTKRLDFHASFVVPALVNQISR